MTLEGNETYRETTASNLILFHKLIVVHVVQKLSYTFAKSAASGDHKTECPGFDSRWGFWKFPSDLTLLCAGLTKEPTFPQKLKSFAHGRKREAYCHVHKTKTLVPVLRQTNPVHALISCFLNICFNFILFLSDFPTNILHVLLFSP